MSDTYDKFAERFGADQADAVMAAAEEHGNGINDTNKGSDAFKWALLIAIGYQCIEIDDYREHHGITAPWDEVRPWIIEHAVLAAHDGDCDYISMFAGVYNEYCGIEEEAA